MLFNTTTYDNVGRTKQDQMAFFLSILYKKVTTIKRKKKMIVGVLKAYPQDIVPK